VGKRYYCARPEHACANTLYVRSQVVGSGRLHKKELSKQALKQRLEILLTRPETYTQNTDFVVLTDEEEEGEQDAGALFLQSKALEAKGERKAALDKYTRAAEVKASELKLGKTALLAQNAARQVCNGCHCHVPYVTAAVATFPCDGCCSPRAAT